MFRRSSLISLKTLKRFKTFKILLSSRLLTPKYLQCLTPKRVFHSHTRSSSYLLSNSSSFLKIFVGLAATLSLFTPIASNYSENPDDDHVNNHISIESSTSKGTKKSFTHNFIADAAEIASPAVVNIVTNTALGQSSGSGFIVSRHGFVVTNAHVVQNSRDGNVLVTFWDSRKKIGKVHAVDKKSDLAVIKLLDLDVNEDLPLAKLGSSAALRVGEFVVALGSPLHLQNTVTFGIVSAVARHASELGLSKNRSEYIQTDAAINVGNSGGPLVNIAGEVIGINVMKLDHSAGISFAIPIDSALAIIRQLVTNKRVIRPYIGLQMAPMVNGNRRSRQRSRDLVTEETSIVIIDVDSSSPASSAGLRSGDIIEEVGGRVVKGVRDVYDAIGLDVNKTIEFKVRRPNGERASVYVTSAAER